jgi:hypothetical protein
MIDARFLLSDSAAVRTLGIECAVDIERDRQRRIFDRAASRRHRDVAITLAFDTDLSAEQVRNIFDQLR